MPNRGTGSIWFDSAARLGAGDRGGSCEACRYAHIATPRVDARRIAQAAKTAEWAGLGQEIVSFDGADAGPLSRK
jgi:hypothetical protein